MLDEHPHHRLMGSREVACSCWQQEFLLEPEMPLALFFPERDELCLGCER